MEKEIDLVEFYKIVLKEYYKSKQKSSVHSKFEEFGKRFKEKLYEIQADLANLDEDDGKDFEEESDVDSLEAFASMDERLRTDEMSVDLDPTEPKTN
jgi:hypothetical protein